MYQLEISLDKYEKLKQCLSEIHPEIAVTLVSFDYALASMGFAEQPPCTVDVDLTEEGCRELLDELMQYEIDAYNQEGSYYKIKKTPQYQKYLRYGWMWDLFHFYYDKNKGR